MFVIMQLMSFLGDSDINCVINILVLAMSRLLLGIQDSGSNITIILSPATISGYFCFWDCVPLAWYNTDTRKDSVLLNSNTTCVKERRHIFTIGQV